MNDEEELQIRRELAHAQHELQRAHEANTGILQERNTWASQLSDARAEAELAVREAEDARDREANKETELIVLGAKYDLLRAGVQHYANALNVPTLRNLLRDAENIAGPVVHADTES